MPFSIHGTISHNGETYERSHIVSDSLGSELLREHPALVVRVPHDDDLCATMRHGQCAHDEHPWNQKPAASTKQKNAADAADAAEVK